MRILIDADGCPVVDATVMLAQEYELECIILCDTAHYFNKAGARTVVLSQGADSVDFALVNMVQAGDIVVTQDYGLAAMCLARRSRPINQNGMRYHEGQPTHSPEDPPRWWAHQRAFPADEGAG